MPRARVIALAAASLLAPMLPLQPAAAQVRRCELPTGATVYTDRRCDAIGAVERQQATGRAQLRPHRAGCPRNLRDLAFEVSAAIESRDVNRLASVYHWSGLSTRQGYEVMQRLQAIVDRPLVDLQAVYPGGGDEADYAPYPPRRAPVALRVEQVSRNGSTPIRATLGLRRHLDCWWVSLGGGAPAPRSTPAGAPVVAAPPEVPEEPPLERP